MSDNKSRFLIINADDFGFSQSVNRAVIRGWQEGVLTSTSLMVTGDAFDEAVELARANPGLQVGLHLTLVQGRSVLTHKGFPSLLDTAGKFPSDPVFAGMRMFFLRSIHRQIEAEIEAQIEKFITTGIPLTHIDGHINIHMHPTVFGILCRLMSKYGIKTFRLSRENLGNELKISRGRLLGKMADAFIFSRLAAGCEPELKARRIGYADSVRGLLNSGGINEAYLLKQLEQLPVGRTEIYLHPADEDDLEEPFYRRTMELGALLSPAVREKIAAKGITLCNYRGDIKSA